MARGTVLIADDDTAIRTVLNQALARAGYAPRATGNAATLWRWVSQGEGDVVLTDVVMPNMDGYELFTTVRERWPDLPILMMTAFHYDRDHVIKRSRMEGLAGVIFKKPVDPDRLRAALGDALGKRGTS